MAEYQVVARKYRPQTFVEVVGQDPVVATVKNARRLGRVAHAYLFCGSRGTGKTTLARLFAKLLNCENPSEEMEPCNECSSCKEIASGSSLDVLEIDGASNRGIEDVRQINETVGFAASRGGYKVYIIDEVHMLTGAAFNALLKTLEEPPPKVVFFFATTEPHKVLPTILSRCQRFNLARISEEKIRGKLSRVAADMGVGVEDKALDTIARVADGGMRDAESILDQLVAFSDGAVTMQLVEEVLGLMPKDSFFELDRAGKEGDFNVPFAIVEQLFREGKEFTHYIDELIEHFRALLLVHTSGSAPTEELRGAAQLYRRDQLLTILDLLVEGQDRLRFASSPRVVLEMLLLRIVRSHQQLSVDVLVRRLAELESKLSTRENSEEEQPLSVEPSSTPAEVSQLASSVAGIDKQEESPSSSNQRVESVKSELSSPAAPSQTSPVVLPAVNVALQEEAAPPPAPSQPADPVSSEGSSPVVSQKASPVVSPVATVASPQPTEPTKNEAPLPVVPPQATPVKPPVVEAMSHEQPVLPLSEPPAPPAEPVNRTASSPASVPAGPKAVPSAPSTEQKAPPAPPPAVASREEMIKQQSRYDTLLQFAAVELDGTLQKK